MFWTMTLTPYYGEDVTRFPRAGYGEGMAYESMSRVFSEMGEVMHASIMFYMPHACVASDAVCRIDMREYGKGTRAYRLSVAQHAPAGTETIAVPDQLYVYHDALPRLNDLIAQVYATYGAAFAGWMKNEAVVLERVYG